MVAPEYHVPEAQLHDSFIRHAARAQLYRYLDYAARPQAAGAVLLDILADDAPVTSFTVPEPVSADDLNDCSINVGNDDTVAVAGTGASLRATLRRGREFLPRLTEIAIGAGASGRAGSAAHRARSTVHYFIALVENPARDPEPFREILADAFSLHYTAEPLTEFDAVRSWVTGRLASVVASEHDIHSIVVKDNGKGYYNAEVTMKSQALFPDGSGAISCNTQHWTMTDDPANDRFPRVTEILIDRDAVAFFGPAPDYEPRQLPR